ITAAHVALAMNNCIGVLRIQRIEAKAMIGVATPNIEDGQVTISRSFVLSPVKVMAIDTIHDLAVLEPLPGANPFARKGTLFETPSMKIGIQPSIARIDTSRPADGEAVFACGYPIGSRALISTVGRVASAWGN